MELNYLSQKLLGKIYRIRFILILSILLYFPRLVFSQSINAINILETESGEFINNLVTVFETPDDLLVDDFLAKVKNHSISI